MSEQPKFEPSDLRELEERDGTPTSSEAVTQQKFVALKAPTRNTDGTRYYSIKPEGDADIQKLIGLGYENSGVFNSKRDAEIFAEDQVPAIRPPFNPFPVTK